MTLAERKRYQRRERELIRQADPELAEQLAAEPTCDGCGCSDSLACPGGCAWAEPGLCTQCAEQLGGFLGLLAEQVAGGRVQTRADVERIAELGEAATGGLTCEEREQLRALADDVDGSAR